MSIVTGVRVLAGVDERGYPVFAPLVWFNVLMGFVYLLAATITWRDAVRGRAAAVAVAAANILVLGLVAGVRLAVGGVAAESVAAMVFRTGLWVGLAATLWWATRQQPAR
ncbi:MAG: hypothetical protein R2909_03705 [Gemmatimonadales bacterium]